MIKVLGQGSPQGSTTVVDCEMEGYTSVEQRGHFSKDTIPSRHCTAQIRWGTAPIAGHVVDLVNRRVGVWDGVWDGGENVPYLHGVISRAQG